MVQSQKGSKTKVLSPCRNICELDPSNSWCTACGRSTAEIAGWAKMDDHQRRAVMRTLAKRLKDLQSAS